MQPRRGPPGPLRDGNHPRRRSVTAKRAQALSLQKQKMGRSGPEDAIERLMGTWLKRHEKGRDRGEGSESSVARDFSGLELSQHHSFICSVKRPPHNPGLRAQQCTRLGQRREQEEGSREQRRKEEFETKWQQGRWTRITTKGS